VDNINTDLREREWVGIDWVYLAQNKDWWRALVYKVMKLRAP
jgi:hypothetical protein